MFEDGEYLYWTGMSRTYHKTQDKLLTISIPFPKNFLDSDIDLDLMLSTWNSLHDTDKIKHQNLKIAYQLFKEISLVYPDYNRYKRLVFSLITCPFDVNSSLEESPGVKSIALLEELFRAVKSRACLSRVEVSDV